MPKYRQLHIKILDSFDFAEMPDDFTRVVWLLLIAVVDSEGRGIDSPAWLRSKMFPLRQDVELDHIRDAMDWLEHRQMVIPYEADGKSFFYIPTWKEYQTGTSKEAKSNFPPPPENNQSTPELLPTNYGATPPQYNTIQYNADSEAQTTAAVFSYYQANIGALTPRLSELIGEAIDKYPPGWIEKAIDIAVENNARKWAYISAILERWDTEGFDAGKRNGKQPAIDPRNIPTEEY